MEKQFYPARGQDSVMNLKWLYFLDVSLRLFTLFQQSHVHRCHAKRKEVHVSQQLFTASSWTTLKGAQAFTSLHLYTSTIWRKKIQDFLSHTRFSDAQHGRNILLVWDTFFPAHLLCTVYILWRPYFLWWVDLGCMSGACQNHSITPLLSWWEGEEIQWKGRGLR